jgi:hypothetical protein
VTTHAPRNPIIRPLNGLDIANQNGMASPKLISRLRTYDVALVTEESVVRPGESPGGNPFKRSIVFMPHVIGDGHTAAMARVWDFVISLGRWFLLPRSG